MHGHFSGILSDSTPAHFRRHRKTSLSLLGGRMGRHGSWAGPWPGTWDQRRVVGESEQLTVSAIDIRRADRGLMDEDGRDAAVTATSVITVRNTRPPQPIIMLTWRCDLFPCKSWNSYSSRDGWLSVDTCSRLYSHHMENLRTMFWLAPGELCYNLALPQRRRTISGAAPTGQTPLIWIYGRQFVRQDLLITKQVRHGLWFSECWARKWEFWERCRRNASTRQRTYRSATEAKRTSQALPKFQHPATLVFIYGVSHLYA